MNPRALKFSSVAGLALAIALLALSLTSGLRASSITGPEALGVTPQGEVWIGVDKELWRASADGALLHTDAATDLGLPGPPSGLVRHPDGHLVATVRKDPKLYALDPSTARVTRTVTPAWPADLKDKGQDAINVAFAPDGRIAIATGGGHTVALFDVNGAFLARTAPGTYRFTNGLWWHGDDLWTTDTNRFALRRLDGHTLAVRQSVSLPDQASARFLGPARAASADDPTAALIRLRNGMIEGRVVIARIDGSEIELPTAARSEPTDVDWLGAQVLASDGATLSVHRWTADGHVLSDFGDDAFARRLQQVGTTRAGLEKRHTLTLRLAIGVFVLAFALAVVAQRAQGSEAIVGPRLDLSRLGTPQPNRVELAALGWRLLWPFAALAACTLLLRVEAVRQWLNGAMPHDLKAVAGVIAAIVVTCLVAAIAILRGLQRKALLPEFEPLFNAIAVRRLRASGSAQLPLAPGEHVVETFLLVRQDKIEPGQRALWPRHARAATRWVVCTNHGVRVFGVTDTSPWLDIEFALADVAGVSTQAPSVRVTGVSPAWLEQRRNHGGWLAVTLADGRVLQGTVASRTVHTRVVALLSASHAARPSRPRAASAAAAVPAGPSRAQAALASAVLPGLGQWWQRRPGTGLLFFLPWAVLLLASAIPLAWTVLGARADVSTRHVLLVFGMQAAYAALAAWDAWQMGRPANVGTAP